MYFPLIERRIAAKDRRLPSTDRRQANKIHSVGNNKRTKQARRKGNDRRTLILDRETLRDYAAFLNKAHEHEEKNLSLSYSAPHFYFH